MCIRTNSLSLKEGKQINHLVDYYEHNTEIKFELIFAGFAHYSCDDYTIKIKCGGENLNGYIVTHVLIPELIYQR